LHIVPNKDPKVRGLKDIDDYLPCIATFTVPNKDPKVRGLKVVMFIAHPPSPQGVPNKDPKVRGLKDLFWHFGAVHFSLKFQIKTRK
jgi:hypothetical protein